MTNVGKQVVSDDSSATVTLVAVEAVPVIAPAAAIAPAKNEVPPVTLSHYVLLQLLLNLYLLHLRMLMYPR